MMPFPAKMPVSFYRRSKDVALFGKNARILLPKVEGCRPFRLKRPYPSTAGRRMLPFSAKTPVSFYRRSKDVALFGKIARILLPKVEGCCPFRQKRPYPSTEGRRMMPFSAKSPVSFYRRSKDVAVPKDSRRGRKQYASIVQKMDGIVQRRRITQRRGN